MTNSNQQSTINNRQSLSDREARLAFWMLAPAFVVVSAFVVFPVIWNLWLSLKPVSLGDLRGASLWQFNLTLENFHKVFSDPDFVAALVTTLIYTIAGSTLSVLLGLIAALLVHEEFPGRGLVRGLFISPYIAPVVAVAFTWSFILDPQLGVLNWVGVDSGLLAQPIPFLSQRWWNLDFMGVTVRVPLALTSVVLFEGWRYFLHPRTATGDPGRAIPGSFSGRREPVSTVLAHHTAADSRSFVHSFPVPVHLDL
jgi:multiple sugar transport system permease protein